AMNSAYSNLTAPLVCGTDADGIEVADRGAEPQHEPADIDVGAEVEIEVELGIRFVAARRLEREVVERDTRVDVRKDPHGPGVDVHTHAHAGGNSEPRHIVERAAETYHPGQQDWRLDAADRAVELGTEREVVIADDAGADAQV